MKPQDLRDLIGRMTAGPFTVDPRPDYFADGDEWSFCIEAGEQNKSLVLTAPTGVFPLEPVPEDSQAFRNATGIATLRNLAPALVELWDLALAYDVAQRAYDEHADALPVNGPEALAAWESRLDELYGAREAAHNALLAAARRVGEA